MQKKRGPYRGCKLELVVASPPVCIPPPSGGGEVAPRLALAGARNPALPASRAARDPRRGPPTSGAERSEAGALLGLT